MSAKNKVRDKNNLSKKLFIVFSLIPILLYFGTFSVYPVFMALYMSFFDWNLLDRVHEFIFLENYTNNFTDPDFWQIMRNTVYFAALNVSGQVVLGLSFALFINSLPKRLIAIMRTTMFLPVVTSMVAVSIMFEWIYQPSFGILNYVLGFIGIGPFDYLSSPTQVIPSLVALTIWKNVGYTMVIFIAGLTTIPRDLYEAAQIDGATKFMQFLRITLPLLKPTTLFVCITGVISSLQAFTQIYTLTRGGPGISSRTIVVHIYETAFKFFNMGTATSMAFILFIVIMLITLIQLYVMRSESNY